MLSSIMETLPDNPSVSQVNGLLSKVKEIYSAIKSIAEAPEGVDEELS